MSVFISPRKPSGEARLIGLVVIAYTGEHSQLKSHTVITLSLSISSAVMGDNLRYVSDAPSSVYSSETLILWNGFVCPVSFIILKCECIHFTQKGDR